MIDRRSNDHDHDDDFPSGPPGVVASALVPLRTALVEPRFRGDPLESLEEPPVTLGELLRGLWHELALFSPRASLA